MKTAEEILKKNVTHEFETRNDNYEIGRIISAMNEYAIEVAREALKNASSKSQEMMYYIDEEDTDNVDILNFKHRRMQSCYAVPKQSILNESNIPKL